ncbi:S8 family serine peptidase [Crocinitomicaceae bacterium]|nr:S8 family serine peptidase [Crocinitomicaceae bacterium]
MKTLKNSLRKTTLSFSMMIFSIVSFAQQDSKVWLTIENENNVPYIDETGNLTSNDVTFNNAISSLNVMSVQKALPSSRNEMLQKVYEVSCNCDVVDLYSIFSNEVNSVSKVEYGPQYQALATPNDYDLIYDHYALNLIGAPDAWNYTIGDSNIIIGISDQNYEVTHEELVGAVVNYDPSNVAPSGHGTAVAIIAAGNTDNLNFKSSIGYNSSLGLYRMNYNEVLSASYNGSQIINLSWTSGCEFNIYQQMAIDEVYNNGSFIVAAAGNGSTCGGPENLVYPSAYDNVFSVTSIGEFDNHESTIGDPSSTHQHNATVDLTAPGYSVWISPSQNWELKSSGTSYASPFVSGTVALMLSVNPCLSNENIEYILKTSSVNIDGINPTYAGLIGEGRLNAAAAVEMAYGFNAITLTANYSMSCGTYGGQIEIDAEGGSSPYTYEWSNGSSDQSLMDLAAGVYSLNVTDASGCSIDTTITIGTYPSTVFEGDIDHVSCYGISNGAIDLTIIEGNPNYSYQWDHGVTTQDIYDLTKGTYRVEITDGNGCISWGSFNVMQPEALTAEISAIEPTEWNDVDLDLSVSGGTYPYYYTWNTGDDSEDLYDVPAGFYEATIVDYNGCVVMADQVIEEENIASIIDAELGHLNIYPNPTSDNATISWENKEISTITILNASGQMVNSIEVSYQNSYQTKDLDSGLYVIILTDLNNNTYTGKLIAE